MTPPARQHFACTACGACCNRAPEMALSEAAALADDFVLRLMISAYWLPQQPPTGERAAPAAFFERKRLLRDFAARMQPVKAMRDGKRVDYTRYIVLSALADDVRAGQCSALADGKCIIHARRPLSCRSVPLHYSRTDAAASADLADFVVSPGYRCDTSDAAPLVIDAGRIVAPDLLAARAEARARAIQDRPWAAAILKRMAAGEAEDLPSLAEVDASAGAGSVTTSMAVAWRIAVDIGLMAPVEFAALIDRQIRLITATLQASTAAPDVRASLVALQAAYQGYRQAGALPPPSVLGIMNRRH